MKTFALGLSLVPLLFASNAVPDYLPLGVGNQWVYQASLGGPRVVEISGVETMNDQTYFVMTGLVGKQLLRRDDTGRILIYDSESGRERTWIDFTAPEQLDRESAAHPCSTTAAIASRRFQGRFHVGEFREVTQVRFGGNVCADAGLTADYYLPGVGLLRRTEITLAGPRNYELIYARVNGALMLTGAERGFTLATDSIRYPWNERAPFRARIRMTLRIQSLLPVDLNFPSSQEYDLVVRDRDGKEVYRWSSTRAFLAVLKTLTVVGEKNWAEELPLADATGRALPVGAYTLEALITTTSGPQYTARVPFEIVEPAP